MKYFYVALIILLTGQLSAGQHSIKRSPKSSSPANNGLIVDAFPEESPPQFPGGMHGFYRYITKNLKYPEVALLVGINGKLRMTFAVNKKGRIVEATPQNCIGAGCEAEAIKLLENSPKWRPGKQNGRRVQFYYTIPMTFEVPKRKVTLAALRKSAHGFIFKVRGNLYTIDEAEKLIGHSFMSQQVEIAEPFFNYNKIEKFNMPDKKDVYLIILKST